MNKFILKHSFLVTFIILAILGWFMYRQFIVKGSPFFPFAILVIIVWVIGTVMFLLFWPRMTYAAFKRAILQHGLDGSVIPVNTLYTAAKRSSPLSSTGSLLATGTSDVLYSGGWLDLSKGPLVLHIPDYQGRYYSIQFTDPSTGTNFAYVGKRTTGTGKGEFAITGPGWKGNIPDKMRQISSPNNSVLVFGRTHVKNDEDLSAAYDLSNQIQLFPLN
jgi:hypothetical protein